MGFNNGPLRVPRFPKTILTCTATATSNPTVQMAEASGFGEWEFALTGTFTGFSVQLYGTIDPKAVNDDGTPNTTYGAPGAAGAAWFPLPAQSTEGTGDTSVFNNPLTAINQIMHYKGHLVAVCAVATGTSPTGTCNVVSWATD
ncbi:MAG: hypothetical protein KGL39_12965 [Patescibacteria group bacterium]|nr:hypothetical protein [Patescibacteria group bacterium]